MGYFLTALRAYGEAKEFHPFMSSTSSTLAGLKRRQIVETGTRLFPTLSPCRRVVASRRMAYLTMEAQIDHGRITVAEPEKLPVTGKAVLTVLDAPPHKPDVEVIKSVIGTLKTRIDVVEWQRRERSEWDERERKQWGDR